LKPLNYQCKLRLQHSNVKPNKTHKLWLSQRVDREPLRRRRDQAHAIGHLVAAYFPHLPYAAEQLKMLPKAVFEDAVSLFAA
jgi:hypothetical protein